MLYNNHVIDYFRLESHKFNMWGSINASTEDNQRNSIYMDNMRRTMVKEIMNAYKAKQ